MGRPLFLFVIGLFFGTGLGFVVAASTGAEFEAHDHGNPAHHGPGSGHAMEHAMLDVSGEAPLPEVQIQLHPDTGGAVNLEIVTRNFVFAPGAVNGPHVPGEGHAHIYINDVKIARAYGPWFHLTDVPEGATIRVTLNANSREALAAGTDPIAASTVLPGS